MAARGHRATRTASDVVTNAATHDRRRAMADTAPWVRIAEADKHVGGDITIKGWLANQRGSGKVQFLHMRDGAGFMQCVLGAHDVDEATFEKAKHLGAESALILEGSLKAEPRAPYCGMEMQVKKVTVVSESQDYPIQKKGKGGG